MQSRVRLSSIKSIAIRPNQQSAQPTPLGELRYMASLQIRMPGGRLMNGGEEPEPESDRKAHFCGAALIRMDRSSDDIWAVTAAHCVMKQLRELVPMQ